MAMMVCTPYVDYAVKVTVSKFVLVVSNISGKVGWVAVCTDQNFVLFSAKFCCLVPNCTIFFIGQSTFGQIIHNCFYCAGLMQSAFREPYIVNDAVFFQIGSELFNVLWQSKIAKCLTAFLAVSVHILVAVYLIECVCMVDYILTLISVLRKLSFRLVYLKISNFE